MHAKNVVTQVMRCCLPLMHAARWRALRDVVVFSVNGHALGLVAPAVGTPAQSACAIASNAWIGCWAIVISTRTVSTSMPRSRGNG